MRLQVDFDGTLHARPVARVKLFGGERIDAVEDFVQVFGPTSFADLIETATQRFVCCWTDEEWLSQCAEIETRAADQKWDAPTTLDFFDLLCGLAGPLDSGVVDRR